MDEMTRRDALARSMAIGMVAALPPAATGADDADDAELERACLIGCGMTEAEADCWEAAGKVAGMFFDLPELHPGDQRDIADAVHVVQYRLMSRPAYRKYKELHKTLSDKGRG
jgi:hypothetical protein